MSSKEQDEEFRDQCIKIQSSTGMNDAAWEAYFGNKEGLYGFITERDERIKKEALENLTASILAQFPKPAIYRYGIGASSDGEIDMYNETLKLCVTAVEDSRSKLSQPNKETNGDLVGGSK